MVLLRMFSECSYIRGISVSRPHTGSNPLTSIIKFFSKCNISNFFFDGVLFPQPLETSSVAVSHRSLKNFGMYNFLNIIFPKLHFHIPPIFTTLYSCKLKWDKLTQKFAQQRTIQGASQAIRCTTTRETETSRHPDSVSSSTDSIIIIVKIHVNCINLI